MGCLKISYQSKITIIDEKQIFVDFGYEKNARTKNNCSNYYSFGMEIPALSSNSSEYSYGFNGMEKDDEVKGNSNSYDFGARMYDNRLGRWLSLDPLAQKYPSLSPYNFVANSPIMYVDPDGKRIKPTNINSKKLIKEAYDRIFSGALEEVGSNIDFNDDGILAYKDEPTLSQSKAKRIIKDSNLSRDEKLTAIAYLNAARIDRTYEVQVDYESGDIEKGIESDLNFGLVTPNKQNYDLSESIKKAKGRGESTREIKREMTGSISGEASSEFYENQDIKSVPSSSGLYNFQVNESGDNMQTNQAFDEMIIKIGAQGAAYQEITIDGKNKTSVTHFINEDGKPDSKEPKTTKIKKK